MTNLGKSKLTEADFPEQQTCSICMGFGTPLGRSCVACGGKGWLTAREALTAHQMLVDEQIHGVSFKDAKTGERVDPEDVTPA